MKTSVLDPGKVLALLLWMLLSLAVASGARADCGDGVPDAGEQCDDGNLLDGDCCSAACQYEPSGSVCDLDACDVGGTCDGAGVCADTTLVVCDDGLFCNGAESCDVLLGCQPGTPPAIDDGVGCTDDSCDEVADVVVHAPNHSLCDDGLLCNGAETCDPALDCQPGSQMGLGALFRGDIVVADHRLVDPTLDPIILAVDPVTGAQEPLTIGGFLTEPRDVAVEANRCVVVPDTNIQAVLRIDPLTYDPLDPGANQRILSQGGNLSHPRGIAIATNGDIYIADSSSADRIHRIDPITGAQTTVAQEGYMRTPRRVTVDAQGLLYVPVYSGPYAPAVVRIDPDAYDPLDGFANEEIVASGGNFSATYGPWDVEVEEDGKLLVLNAQDWNLIRVDMAAYDPLDPYANQEIVADGGGFLQTRGMAIEEDGHPIVTNEGGTPTVIRVDPDAYDPLDQPANQTVIASGLPMVEPHGAEVVRMGSCGNGTLDPGEQCDDGNERDGDCCSAVCQYEPPGSSCEGGVCYVDWACDGAGACAGSAPVVCDDGLFCNGSETCDAVLGCQPGTPPVIDDGVGCTDDSCDEVGDVVVHAPNDGLCDDTLFCNGSETCDVALDCRPGTPPLLDDGVGCTDDSCDEVGDVVVHAPNDGLCDDTLFCNGSETCDVALDCQPGTPPLLDDSVECTIDLCDETEDIVLHVEYDPVCEDHDSCTAEACDEVAGCTSTPIPGCGVPLPTGGAVASLVSLALTASGLGALGGWRRRSGDKRA